MSATPGSEAGTGRHSGSLRSRLLLLVVFALVVQGGILGLLWGFQSAERIRHELRSRGRASAATLALAARAAIQFEDQSRMEELLRGALEQDPDVLYVCFTRSTQEILAKRVRGEFAEEIESIVRLAKTAPSKVYGFPEEAPEFLDIWEKVVTVRERASEQAQAPAASETELFGPEGPSAPPTAGPVGEYTWGYVHIGMSLKSTAEAARRGVLYALGTTLLTVLVASAAAFVLSNRIAAPLEQMVRVALRIARGDYSQSIGVQGTGEVQGLAEAFRGMQGNLHEIARQARSIAEGDLTRRVDAEGDLASAFNEMVRSLSMLVGQIQQAGFQIAAASNEILAATRQQEQGSQEQSASISETTSTMDELLSASKQIAVSADAVAKIAESTLAAAREGQESVREAIRGMEEIRENHRATAQRILELSERNQQIGAIVEIIDDIADKTDILAVNAAIEGAKAGEAGKGFAVVASELRKLAEDVVISTREIREIVSEIQKASQASVSATESQMRITETGMDLSVRTGERLQRILEGVQQTTEASRQISLATQQQRTGTEQVVTSMSEISKIAKQNVAVSGQTTASTRQLSTLADELRRAVSRFRLSQGNAGQGPPDRSA